MYDTTVICFPNVPDKFLYLRIFVFPFGNIISTLEEFCSGYHSIGQKFGEMHTRIFSRKGLSMPVEYRHRLMLP